MLSNYKVWCPDLDESEEEAKTYLAFDVSHAAREYAERSYADDPFDSMTVVVKGEDGEECRVFVEAIPSVEFYTCSVEE